MRVALLVAGLLVAITAPPARADKVITAETVWRFGETSYAMQQGEAVTFTNNDAVSPGPHNVTAMDNGPNGKPLFASDTVSVGQSAPVKLAGGLPPGSYGFYCTVHPFMTAKLVVAAAATPATPPEHSGVDTTAPGVDPALAKARLHSKRFRATVIVDEDSSLRLRLTARVGHRAVLVGTDTATAAAHDAVRVTVRASKAARRALAHAKRATLTLAVEARDAVGNVGTATARQYLRR